MPCYDTVILDASHVCLIYFDANFPFFRLKLFYLNLNAAVEKLLRILGSTFGLYSDMSLVIPSWVAICSPNMTGSHSVEVICWSEETTNRLVSWRRNLVGNFDSKWEMIMLAHILPMYRYCTVHKVVKIALIQICLISWGTWYTISSRILISAVIFFNSSNRTSAIRLCSLKKRFCMDTRDD